MKTNYTAVVEDLRSLYQATSAINTTFPDFKSWYDSLSPKGVIIYWLQWNGIIGYDEDLINLFQFARDWQNKGSSL